MSVAEISESAIKSKLLNLIKVLEDAEAKENAYLRGLYSSNTFKIVPGKLEYYEEAENKQPYLLTYMEDGMPIWYDISATTVAAPRLTIGLQVLLPEYEAAYAQLRIDQINAAKDGQELDGLDAVQALIYATLVKDRLIAEELLEQLRNKLPEIAPALQNWLGRGSIRLRSIFVRLLATSNDPQCWEAVLKELENEECAGVRADVIFYCIYKNPTGLAAKALDKWLGSPYLTDVLSCVMALSFTATTTLDLDLLDKIHPDNREIMRSWFQS